MYFHNFFPELIMAASIPGIENFSWKSVCEVFFNMQNWNFRVAPESERTGCVLIHRRAITDRLPFLWVKWLFWNRNLKTIPSEYKDILYIILNRPLKWDRARLWTPPGSASTSRQSWMFEKNLCFTTKTNVFFERSTLTASIFESSGNSETYCTSF